MKSKSASLHQGITGYLAGAAGFTAVLAAPQADAAVTAVTFGFGPELSATDGIALTSVGPGFGTLAAQGNSESNFMGYFIPYLGMVYHTASGGPSVGRAKFFDYGTTIGAGGNGDLGAGLFQMNGNPALDFTADQLDKNIAFKTSTANWGWANVSWTEDTKILTIHSAFVESVPNTPITITAVPEPSVAGLLVLGAFGVVQRRRRQQAA